MAEIIRWKRNPEGTVRRYYHNLEESCVMIGPHHLRSYKYEISLTPVPDTEISATGIGRSPKIAKKEAFHNLCIMIFGSYDEEEETVDVSWLPRYTFRNSEIAEIVNPVSPSFKSPNWERYFNIGKDLISVADEDIADIAARHKWFDIKFPIYYCEEKRLEILTAIIGGFYEDCGSYCHTTISFFKLQN